MTLTTATLLLSALSLLQPTSSILPEAPEGWRHERLDFPLAFAPTLEYTGFEELYFAPGMFTAESDSYFSYVLALELEGDLDVDAAWIRSFLHAYYAGLCDAVGKGRGLDLDLSKIRVEVQGKEERFEATLEMYDAFVTGKAMTLFLEISTITGNGSTELFGAASPLSKESPIWNDLRKLHDLWRIDRSPIGSFNHLFVIPDQATYDAIAGSDFVRNELATFEARTTTRGDLTYTGIYFYGNETYFEFLPPGGGGLTEGATGIALGIESVGGTKRAAGQLNERGIQTFTMPVTRNLGEKQVPWFEMMGVQQAHADSRLRFFTMEYVPGFLERWHADRFQDGTGISRRAILDRYRAVLGKKDGSPLLEDVTRIDLALDPSETERFATTCEALGHHVKKEKGSTICRGPGIRFHIRPSEKPGGIVSFTLALREEAGDRPPIRLGRSEIRFEGREATWTFEP